MSLSSWVTNWGWGVSCLKNSMAGVPTATESVNAEDQNPIVKSDFDASSKGD